MSNANKKIKNIKVTDVQNTLFKDELSFRPSKQKKIVNPSISGEFILKMKDRYGNLIELVRKKNVVVIVGRNTLMQTITSVPFTVKDIFGNDITDATAFKLSHFAMGNGAATVTAPYTLTTPSVEDYQLFNIIPRVTTPSVEYTKAITSIEFASDPDNQSDVRTTLKFVLDIDRDEFNTDANGNPSQILNEAALLLTDGTSYIMYNHAVFNSVPKTVDYAYQIEWYIYF